MGVAVYDVATIRLVLVVPMLGAVTLVTTTIPGLRVARIDPAETLREE
jgi:ABC-type lipoprotein release transport system permease subunit